MHSWIQASRTQFIGNTAAVSGALKATSLLARNCTFNGNFAFENGGAIQIEAGSGIFDIGNTVFMGNTATNPGGAIVDKNGFSLILMNCTFAGNQTFDDAGSSIFLNNNLGQVNLANSLFVGNSPASNTLYTVATNPDSFNLIQCEVESGTTSLINALGADGISGTLDDDPSLALGSSAIDAGNPEYVSTDEFDYNNDGNTIDPIEIDWAGNNRLVDTGLVPDQCLDIEDPLIDIGAVEFIPMPLTLTILPANYVGKSRHRVWTFYFNQDVSKSFDESSISRIGTLAGNAQLAFWREGSTVTVAGFPLDPNVSGTLGILFDGRVEGAEGGIYETQTATELEMINSNPNADVNGDDMVDSADIITLKNVILGLP